MADRGISGSPLFTCVYSYSRLLPQEPWANSLEGYLCCFFPAGLSLIMVEKRAFRNSYREPTEGSKNEKCAKSLQNQRTKKQRRERKEKDGQRTTNDVETKRTEIKTHLACIFNLMKMITIRSNTTHQDTSIVYNRPKPTKMKRHATTMAIWPLEAQWSY